MIDYAESIEKISKLRREAHDALLMKNWSVAYDLANEIAMAASAVKRFAAYKLHEELERKG